MEAITWVPGTNPELDKLFEVLRIEQYNDHSHRLWKNYGADSFASVTALTICFNDSYQPEICSSITSKDCWPTNVYRIHNRVWKITNKKEYLRTISLGMGIAAQSQIEWLCNNTKSELYFISRQTNNWNNWMIKHFSESFGIHFKTDKYAYLTCPNECDETCWQTIIYNGDEQLLTKWKRR